MVWIHRHCDLECLVGEPQVTNADGNLPDVVPDICHVIVICQHEGTFKATERQIVLPCIKTAKSHVIPKFCIDDAVLQHATIESQCELRLICIEMMRSKTCNCFWTNRIVLQ